MSGKLGYQNSPVGLRTADNLGEYMFEENFAYGFVAGLVLLGTPTAIILWKIFASMDAQKAKNEAEEADRKQRQLLDTQENIGNRIYNNLLIAAAKNLSQLVRVQRIKNNAGAYSIFVGLEDSTSYTLGGLDYRGYPIVGITLRMFENPPLTASFGPYPNSKNGTEVYYDANDDQVSLLIDVVGRHVAEYSLYEE